MDAFDGTGFQPFDLDDLEPGRLDERELTAGEVLARRADRDPLQQPLRRPNRWLGAPDVVDQQQPSTRDRRAAARRPLR
jgi:hypothetical protein